MPKYIIQEAKIKCADMGCKKIDYTGKRIGIVTAGRPTEKRTKSNCVLWECFCDCGNVIFVPSDYLRREIVTSCGCVVSSVKQYRRLTTNHRSGILTAIRKSERRDKRGHFLWECICDCGNVSFVRSHDLLNGNITSCGCLRIKDLTNQRFGYLFVIRITSKRQSGSAVWECLCDCGNLTYVKSNNLQNGSTTSCGCRATSYFHEQVRESLLELGYEIHAEEYPLEQKYFTIDERISRLRVDLIIETRKGFVAVECQGRQHYEPVEYFGGEEAFYLTQERDALKRKCLAALGFPLIEVQYDCPDIEAFLKQELERYS